MQDRPGPFTLREGAAALGISLNTLRRRIASGQVRAEQVQRPQGFIWQVYLDGAAPSHEGANETVQRDRPGTVQQPPTALMQAEAMAAYTRSLLEPMVSRMAEQETVIREQAETIGRQSAELERAAATIVSLSDALDARTAPQQPQEAPTAPNQPAPATDVPVSIWRSWRVLAPWAMLVAILLLAVVVGWPPAWPR
jgi:hypothetical protein